MLCWTFEIYVQMTLGLCVTMLPKTLKDLPLETGKDMFRAKTDAVKMVVHLRAPEVGFSRPGKVLTPH